MFIDSVGKHMLIIGSEQRFSGPLLFLYFFLVDSSRLNFQDLLHDEKEDAEHQRVARAARGARGFYGLSEIQKAQEKGGVAKDASGVANVLRLPPLFCLEHSQRRVDTFFPQDIP